MNGKSARASLFNAVASATPSCAEMFANVQGCSAPTRNDKTNPLPRAAPAAASTAAAAPSAIGKPVRDEAPTEHPGCSEMFSNVQEASSKMRSDKTNPNTLPAAPLTPRQVAAARLLALGRSGRAAAAEVEAHTVTRWRRSPAFVDEVRRQHELVLAEQVRQRRAEQVDAFAATAERIARKYGMAR